MAEHGRLHIEGKALISRHSGWEGEEGWWGLTSEGHCQWGPVSPPRLWVHPYMPRSVLYQSLKYISSQSIIMINHHANLDSIECDFGFGGVAMIKTFGTVSMKWIYFSYVKGMNLRNYKERIVIDWIIPPCKIPMLNPLLKWLLGNRVFKELRLSDIIRLNFLI